MIRITHILISKSYSLFMYIISFCLIFFLSLVTFYIISFPFYHFIKHKKPPICTAKKRFFLALIWINLFSWIPIWMHNHYPLIPESSFKNGFIILSFITFVIWLLIRRKHRANRQKKCTNHNKETNA